MFEAMYTAASGLLGQQRRIDTIADNLANVNTTAFKSSRLNFKDMIYVDGRYPYRDEALNQQKGHGVLPASISRNFQTGNMQTTERDLDFAIEGEGFFMVGHPDGNIYYTRQGNFYLSNVGGQMHLVNSRGHLMLDDEGAPIVMPEGAISMSANTDGGISFNYADGTFESAGQFGIRTFVNPEGLMARGTSYFEPSIASGAPQATQNYNMRQGVIEASNVDLSNEMTRMIRTQRAFSLASRALTTADRMEEIANRMRS